MHFRRCGNQVRDSVQQAVAAIKVRLVLRFCMVFALHGLMALSTAALPDIGNKLPAGHRCAR